MGEPVLCEYCHQREARSEPYELPFNRAGIENITLRVAVCDECLKNAKRMERASRLYGMVMVAGFFVDAVLAVWISLQRGSFLPGLIIFGVYVAIAAVVAFGMDYYFSRVLKAIALTSHPASKALLKAGLMIGHGPNPIATRILDLRGYSQSEIEDAVSKHIKKTPPPARGLTGRLRKEMDAIPVFGDSERAGWTQAQVKTASAFAVFTGDIRSILALLMQYLEKEAGKNKFDASVEKEHRFNTLRVRVHTGPPGVPPAGRGYLVARVSESKYILIPPVSLEEEISLDEFAEVERQTFSDWMRNTPAASPAAAIIPQVGKFWSHGETIAHIALQAGDRNSASQQHWAASASGATIQVWDVESEKLACTITTQGGQVTALAIHPLDSVLVAAVHENGQTGGVEIYQLPEGNLVDTKARRHETAIAAVSVSSGGYLATLGEDGQVKVTHLVHPQYGYEDRLPAGGVGLAFSDSDQHWLSATSKDGTVQLWDYTRQMRRNTASLPGSEAVVISQNARLVAGMVAGQMCRLVDITDTDNRSEFPRQGKILAVSYRQSDDVIVWRAQGRALTGLSLPRAVEWMRLDHPAEVTRAVSSMDGKVVLTAAGKYLGFWKLAE